MAQKETILGNYLGFARFPLDCESIAYLQVNTQLLAVIARLSGCDKLILSGCDGDPRKEGYVYIRTGNDLVGEVVYFKGGTGTRCKIQENTDFNVTANGETFRNAYTKRVLESSSSPSDMAWDDFTKLSDISNAALKTAVNGKAAASHTHPIGNITGLQSALDGKAASNHTHNYSAPGHTHAISNITGLQSALDGKAAASHTHNYSAPGHTHAISNITGLQSALDGKAAASHTHTIANVSGLQDALNGKANNIRLSSYASDDGKITALRWGNVVTLHINGVQTYNQSSQVYTDRDVVQLPKKFQPTIGETVYGVGFRGYATGFENSGITLCIKNANLDNPNNNVIIQWYRASGFNNAGYIFATLTYITQNPDS